MFVCTPICFRIHCLHIFFLFGLSLNNTVHAINRPHSAASKLPVSLISSKRTKPEYANGDLISAFLVSPCFCCCCKGGKAVALVYKWKRSCHNVNTASVSTVQTVLFPNPGKNCVLCTLHFVIDGHNIRKGNFKKAFISSSHTVSFCNNFNHVIIGPTHPNGTQDSRKAELEFTLINVVKCTMI